MRQYYEDNKCPITLHWDSVFCIYVKIIKIISKDLKKMIILAKQQLIGDSKVKNKK